MLLRYNLLLVLLSCATIIRSKNYFINLEKNGDNIYFYFLISNVATNAMSHQCRFLYIVFNFPTFCRELYHSFPNYAEPRLISQQYTIENARSLKNGQEYYRRRNAQYNETKSSYYECGIDYVFFIHICSFILRTEQRRDSSQKSISIPPSLTRPEIQYTVLFFLLSVVRSGLKKYLPHRNVVYVYIYSPCTDLCFVLFQKQLSRSVKFSVVISSLIPVPYSYKLINLIARYQVQTDNQYS